MFTSTRRASGRTVAKKPNIIVIVLDDVGYSDLGCFGGEIRTPNMDALARRGVRFSHFDTKAVCSATRASLLTGRNCHTVMMPDVPDMAKGAKEGEYAPGMFHMPTNAETVAQALQREGYATWAIGKWHLIPLEELPEQAGRTSWPLQRGFDYFYGFPLGWTDQYHPTLLENNDYIHPRLPTDYHLSVDLVDRAITRIDDHMKKSPEQPFYLHLAFGAGHSPIQVPREYSEKYDAVYSVGWDEIRSSRLERMERLGIVPPGTVQPERNTHDRAWAELSMDEKTVFARFMAVYAGFLEHADAQIGRLTGHLSEHDLNDDTVIVLLSDNGAASEAGQNGYFEHLYVTDTLTPAQERQRLDDLGTDRTESEYPRPWGMASVTPLRRYKLWPYSGGTRTPLIFVCPHRIRDPGAIRKQFVDVIDIAPTLLELAGTRFSTAIDGVRQLPVAGVSFLGPVTHAAAPPTRTVQYVEIRGGRAITQGKWRAVALHACSTSFADDRWELFDLEKDFSESRDLSSRFPDRLATLKTLWAQEWARYSPYPLRDPPAFVCNLDENFDRPASVND